LFIVNEAIDDVTLTQPSEGKGIRKTGTDLFSSVRPALCVIVQCEQVLTKLFALISQSKAVTVMVNQMELP